MGVDWAKVFNWIRSPGGPPVDTATHKYRRTTNTGTNLGDTLLQDANTNVGGLGISLAKSFGPELARGAVKYPALAGVALLATPQGRTVAASVVAGTVALVRAPAVTLFGGDNGEQKIDSETDTGGVRREKTPAVTKARTRKAPVRKPVKRRKAPKRKPVKRRKAVRRPAVKRRKAVKRKVSAR